MEKEKRPTLEKILEMGFICISKEKYGTYSTFAKGNERILYNKNKDSIELYYKV